MASSTLIPIKIKPGLVRDTTDYSNRGGWWDANWVRFRNGLPEKMGGWQKDNTETFLGSCRNLINWTEFNSLNHTGFGTNLKYYILTGGNYTDITPIRRTVTLGASPFSATSGSSVLTVTDVSHGALVNDFVTFSAATTFAGIAAATLNAEFKITEIVSTSVYKIDVVTLATSTASGGGTPVAAYQINTGLDTYVPGAGWGAGTWGRGTWSSASSVTTAGAQIGLWSSSLFGEDLIINQRGGGIYYWDVTVPSARAVDISTLAGASDTPTVATEVIVSDVDRHTIAFGCNPIGSGVADPMFVRWSDTESAANWTPVATNTAGGFRLSAGSEISTVYRTKQEILIWTDAALYSMQFVGAPYVFSLGLISANVNIIGPKGKIVVNDTVYWMGRDQFYLYNGRVNTLPCPVRDYIFSRLNTNQSEKVYAGSNIAYNEVSWYYPSTTDENDSYVSYNYVENTWTFGSISRTAWLDKTIGAYPTATSNNGIYYTHEYGFDDGSTNPPQAISAYIESSPVEIGEGSDFMFIRHAIPDITFRSSTATSPVVNFVMQAQDQPGSSFTNENDKSVTRTASSPVETYTDKIYVRLRGRALIFRVESDTTGVGWRLGTPRVMATTDGLR